MKFKRFLIKFIKGFAISALILTVFAGIAISYYKHNKTDEATINQEYKTEKQKCDMLEMIADDFVLEGQGINTMELPHDIIYYKLYNTEDNNIVFYYYLKENDDYNAKITLSFDYNIIDEVYNTKIEDYEEYKKTVKFADYMNAILSSIMITSVICIICLAIIWVILLIFQRSKNSKNKDESNNNSN